MSGSEDNQSPQLSPVAQAMLWERMSGERLTEAEHKRLLDGGQFTHPVTPDRINHQSAQTRLVDGALLSLLRRKDLDFTSVMVQDDPDGWRERMTQVLKDIGVLDE